MTIPLLSFYNDLLRPDVLTLDQADHIDAGGAVDGLADAAVYGLAAQDAPHGIDDLEGGLAFVGDDPVAVAEEGEVFVFVFVIVFVGHEHQFETAGVVAGLGGEGVARSGEEVHIVTCEVVDQVEIGER